MQVNTEAERAKTILDLQPLVKSIVRRVHRNLPPHIDRDTLLSEGNLALIEAYERYDSTKGTKFSTFATTRVNGALLDFLRSIDNGTRSMRRAEKDLKEMQTKLAAQLGREVTVQEAANEIGMDEKTFAKHQLDYHQAIVGSLEHRVGSDEDGAELGTRIADHALTPEDSALVEDRKAQLHKAIMAVLNEREQTVIALHYFEEMTLKELGEIFGVTEGRVSQIHHAALDKLEEHFGTDVESVFIR